MKFFIGFAAVIVVASAFSDFDKWAEFKAKHSKNYNLVEDKYRFQIFQDNLRKIENHNAKYNNGEVSYFLKITKFADWSQEEFNSILKAQSPSRSNAGKNIFNADPKLARPDSIDWRDKNAVLEVKDQGNCGSCWAFSTTGTIEGQLLIHKNLSISLSEQELVDCVKNSGCGGGDVFSAYMHAMFHGLSSEEQYQYTASDGTCQNIENKALAALADYGLVDANEDALADAVATIGPISIGIAANQDWSLYGGGIFDHDDCGHFKNHAVLAVGYTDDYWIIKNSWGASWGEDGYIRLVRGKSECGVADDASYALV